MGGPAAHYLDSSAVGIAFAQGIPLVTSNSRPTVQLPSHSHIGLRPVPFLAITRAPVLASSQWVRVLVPLASRQNTHKQYNHTVATHQNSNIQGHYCGCELAMTNKSGGVARVGPMYLDNVPGTCPVDQTLDPASCSWSGSG